MDWISNIDGALMDINNFGFDYRSNVDQRAGDLAHYVKGLKAEHEAQETRIKELEQFIQELVKTSEVPVGTHARMRELLNKKWRP